ncbi:hypothetical protein [Promicromonospora sp. NPDC059942]|uniref:hypothetical protein n=1 Tax=Promicromonospora sp. NPDC059942 TaxID=3347009 RepID=UPI00365DAF84
MEQFTAEQVDVFLLVVLGICVFILNDMDDPGGFEFTALLIGFVAFGVLAVPFVGQLFDGGVEETPLNWIKLFVIIGVVIWFVIKVADGDTSSSSSGSGASSPSSSSDSGLVTRDGVRVEVGNGVWSQNHRPWSITSVESGWVHLDYDWDGSEQEPTMIAVEDFDRYYYKHHPSGPMSCATAGCRHRPWGER